ncbi:LLM class flavin-dependent oxidoreductase [Paludisphaera soli]|uniref:LLM class flavin-dependent oxidoreductase n=1 Tax=Paludisphaera soli TaxID=2712865 RepID=UPI0019825834|nr:LLM class flavin-dependent oxidoreductase [Paludisphaera soli]
MKRLEDLKASVLDLCPIVEGGTAADAFRDAVDLARHAERLGFERYWVAEHHNIPGVASAATAVVIGHVAGATSRIRAGAGGIMLPNHPPLVIAEQFGTLASLYPGRIDLGLGRAPGGDQRTAQALRRYFEEVDAFPRDVRELQAYFRPATPGRFVHAVPGEGLDVPIWLLGSSDFSARLAAELGLPFAFASHFAPDRLFDALAIYRESFVPSEALDEPYAMIGVNAFVAETDEAAARLFTSHQQAILNLVRGRPGLMPPPVDDMDRLWAPAERAAVERMTRVTVVGSPDTVRARLQSLVNATQPDEIIFCGQIYDHAARLRSYELLMQACRTTTAAVG